MKSIIITGVSYNLDEISEETRKEDMAYMMKRGNHKSALDPANAPTLAQNYEKDVRHGWILPVTVEFLPKII